MNSALGRSAVAYLHRVRRVFVLTENLYVRAAVGGALVGLIAFALPLTAIEISS